MQDLGSQVRMPRLEAQLAYASLEEKPAHDDRSPRLNHARPREPVLPHTPQSASFWYEQAVGASHSPRSSNSPGPSSGYSSSPRPRSALTNSLLDSSRPPASPSASHLPASPAARAYMQATGALRHSPTSNSPHTSPRMGKRTLTPLGDFPEQLSSASSRRGSVASSSRSPSLAPTQHSRRPSHISLGEGENAQATRPGIYLPPHLRHRNSGQGLTPSIAHYDRMRTPSLRGQSRSRESSISATHRSSISSSRPPSTSPFAICEDRNGFANGGAPLTSEAVAQHLSTQQQQQSERPSLARTFTLSSLASSRYADELEQKLETHGFSSSNNNSPNRAGFARQGWSDRLSRKSIDDFGGDIELSAEDVMRSTLTDSYVMSRRTSFASGLGAEGVIDIFDEGDRIGPGMMHDGHLITIAETSNGFDAQHRDTSGSKLEVVGKLGEGSYACVYLVREVFDDDTRRFGEHTATAATPEASNIPISATPTATQTFSLRSRNTDVGDLTLTSDMATLRADESPLASRQAQEQEGQAPREFALKCLCKRDLSQEMLELQRLEATIHQSIPAHPHIVTLYRTYETPDWLFLVLEYCPGQDLFYWLEQAQDEVPSPQIHLESFGHASQAHDATPPDPSLLATTAGASILSRRRLRLISRMFRQMCDAVQFCHDSGISHRDLKPENFIVEDLRSSPLPSSPTSLSDSFREGDHKVNVKLTDFGLATAEERCQDFECGSKPYMSFECRNNVESSYDPQMADVWSLGIVLLNMLFHRNPFKEPAPNRCPSFAAFQEEPVRFLMEAFDGLTEEVSTFLAQRVFCDVRTQQRITAAEFGAWAGDLVELMGLSTSTRSSTPSRGASMGITSPLQHSRSRSSLLSASSSVVVLPSMLSPTAIPEDVPTEQPEPVNQEQKENEEEALEILLMPNEKDDGQPHSGSTKSADSNKSSPSEPNFPQTSSRDDADSSDDEESNASKAAPPGRRRKRGARKGRSSSRQPGGTVPSSPQSPSSSLFKRPSLEQLSDRVRHYSSHDDILTGLAEASQNLAREISKASHEKRNGRPSFLGPDYARHSTESEPVQNRSPLLRPVDDSRRQLQDSGRTQPTSWRDRNRSTMTVSSTSSLSSDDVSIYSTASAPAAFARRSHDSSRQQRQNTGLFGQSPTGLQPISEKGKKELDASYLAEIFGGNAGPRKGRRDGHHSHSVDTSRPNGKRRSQAVPGSMSSSTTTARYLPIPGQQQDVGRRGTSSHSTAPSSALSSVSSLSLQQKGQDGSSFGGASPPNATNGSSSSSSHSNSGTWKLSSSPYASHPVGGGPVGRHAAPPPPAAKIAMPAGNAKTLAAQPPGKGMGSGFSKFFRGKHGS